MRIIFELVFLIMSIVTLHYLGALDHVVLQIELMTRSIEIYFFLFFCHWLIYVSPICFTFALKKKKILYILL